MVKQMLILKEKVACDLERYIAYTSDRIEESDAQIINALYWAFVAMCDIVDSGWYFSFIMDRPEVFRDSSLIPLYAAYEVAITQFILESKSSNNQIKVLEELSEIQNAVWAEIMQNIERINWYTNGGKIIYRGRWK